MLRRLSTARLLGLLAVVVIVLGGGAAIAVAALNTAGPTPPPKPLDAAIHDALTGPPVAGITARITFTNRLVDTTSLGGSGMGSSSPLLSGANGRLWASADGRVRVELQSDNGDVQVAGDGRTVTIVDGTQNQAYRILLPAGQGSSSQPANPAPTVSAIDRALQRLAGRLDVSGAMPSNVAGREAYAVRVSPKQDGGLVGAAELAWDAANGVPLRAAVYAKGDPRPVLQLAATDISFGPVAAADLAAPIPSGTKVTTVDLAGRAPASGGGSQPVTNDPAAVARQLSFPLSAPASLAGQPRSGVRLVGSGAQQGALVTYGSGLGGLVVLEQPTHGTQPSAPAGSSDQALRLPTVSIDGVQAQELPTALGTVLRFDRGGVQYVVLGSVPAATAQAAARGL